MITAHLEFTPLERKFPLGFNQKLFFIRGRLFWIWPLFFCVSVACKRERPIVETINGWFETKPKVESRARYHAEILSEMHRVLLEQEPESRSEFGSLVDSLNQGASLEGIYNGLSHSSHFRELETQMEAASPCVLSRFGLEMTRLTRERAVPTVFRRKDAAPLPEVVHPLDEDPNVNVVDYGQSKEEVTQKGLAQKTDEELAAWYSALFVGASRLTLKRVLGDEAIEVMDLLGQDRDRLVKWYSEWVPKLEVYHVDFGLPERNKTDTAFHFAWASKSTTDALKWEVLNRLFRVLNACR